VSRSWWWCRGVLIALLYMASLPATAAIDPDDLLPVDEAFALRVEAVTRERIELTWTIADGYYLYRHRMDVQRVEEGFKINPVRWPAGEKHHDEFFGNVETYRDSVSAVVTGAAADGMRSLTLRVKYQGCADAGICYPPQLRTIKVALPAGAGDDAFAALGRTLGGQRPAPLAGANIATDADALPLPPEQAFGFEAIAGDGETLLLRFTPAQGYYLYRDRTALALDARGIALGAPRWPQGVAHRDEHFGDVVVYFDQVDVAVPLRRSSSAAQTVVLTATFQGCQDEGICYPPMTRRVRVDIPASRVAADASEGKPVPSPARPALAHGDRARTDGSQAPALTPLKGGEQGTAEQSAAALEPSPGGDGFDVASNTAAATRSADGNDAAEQAEDTRLAAALSGPQRWWTLLGFFGAGLLLAFTPCVLPMIPILSGLIAGHGTRLGTGRALLLSFIYVLANALVFTAAGVVAALLGANLQAAFQTPWIIVMFAALFIALALSSFGLYELQLPHALRARLGAVSDRQRGGSLAGVAAMGALSALIVGPCVAPPLAAAVLYIGQAQDPLFGGAALFLLAMGMGTPLLAFGVAAGRGLPTSGPWMVAAQRVFGFVFLALAAWMLSRLLPAAAALALYGLLALAAAAWAFAALRTIDSERGRWLARFAGLAFAVVGAAELLGAFAGGHDPLQPLAGAFGRQQTRELPFRTIKSAADLDRELAAAAAAGKPLLLDFYADWCVACKEMEKYTFPEAQVQAALAGFTLLKADVTANDAVDQALMKRLGIIGPPATLFYGVGRERRELRLFGFEQPTAFAARARRAAHPGDNERR
jgi:thiol:disulfide interchange protein DsbD